MSRFRYENIKSFRKITSRNSSQYHQKQKIFYQIITIHRKKSQNDNSKQRIYHKFRNRRRLHQLQFNPRKIQRNNKPGFSPIQKFYFRIFFRSKLRHKKSRLFRNGR